MLRRSRGIVLTITPNPALDLGGLVDRISPNEKSYVSDETRAPGGNAINAARILHRLKVPVVASGFIGGSTGQEINSLLGGEGLSTKFIQIKGHSRINVTVSSHKTHLQTRLSFPGPLILAKEKIKLSRLIKSYKNIDLLVFGGSLPKGIGAQDLLNWLRWAKQHNIDCVVDTPGRMLRELLKGEPLFIKPNLTEFRELTGSSVKSVAQVLREAKRLKPLVPYVCVSSVEGGAVFITPYGDYFGRIPKIKVRSTVGAGDSMVGAMTARLYARERSAEQIFKWGLASAAATLESTGTELGSARAIRRHYRKIKVTKI